MQNKDLFFIFATIIVNKLQNGLLENKVLETSTYNPSNNYLINTAINEKKKCIPDYQINDEVIADISDDFNQVELRLLLANALRKLNKDEQLILVLFYFQNEKIADISRITGIPASTVKSKLKRCKEKMKKFLEEGGNQYENFV